MPEGTTVREITPSGNIAIIGGTGFEQLPPEIFAEPLEIETRYGIARVLSISNNDVEPNKLYFLSRHGATHGLAPHQINYAANIAALVALDVNVLFSFQRGRVVTSRYASRHFSHLRRFSRLYPPARVDLFCRPDFVEACGFQCPLFAPSSRLSYPGGSHRGLSGCSARNLSLLRRTALRIPRRDSDVCAMGCGCGRHDRSAGSDFRPRGQVWSTRV